MTTFKTVSALGLDVFYREAGDPGSPRLLLLGGFPSSSHQFRNLLPTLSHMHDCDLWCSRSRIRQQSHQSARSSHISHLGKDVFMRKLGCGTALIDTATPG
jgi:hypothetical protein